MSLLVVYGTVEGQTGKIARFVEQLAREGGAQVQLVDTADQDAVVNFEGVDAVILAASVHERRHPPAFESFLANRQAELDSRRTLMMSVSMNAAFPEGMEEAQDYLDEMKMRTELDPEAELLVAGALNASKYDYYASLVLKHIVLRGRNYDPSVEQHEFTDWDVLSAVVTEFLERSKH